MVGVTILKGGVLKRKRNVFHMYREKIDALL